MEQQLLYLNQLKQMTELYQFMVKLCWLKTITDGLAKEESTDQETEPKAQVKEKSASGAKKSAPKVSLAKPACKSLSHQEKSKVSTIDPSEVIKGRMYDFNNGRFLSVDPYIQGTDSQAINPYSYIDNNPLSGTDPTGYRKSICGQEGQRKCDGVIGGNGSSRVWGKAAATNGKQVQVYYVIGSEDGKISEILAQDSQGNVTSNKYGIERFGDGSFRFLSETDKILFVFERLTTAQGDAGLLAMNDGNLSQERMLQQALGKDPFNSDKEFEDFKNYTTDLTASLLIPYYSCLSGCSLGEFVWSTAELIPIAKIVNFLKPLKSAREGAQEALGQGLIRVASRSKNKTPATTIAGTSTETGVSAFGQSVKGCGGKRCAELDVAAQLGGNPKNIIFTKPVRPRTGEIIPVCTDFQKVFDKSQFPPGTPFDK